MANNKVAFLVVLVVCMAVAGEAAVTCGSVTKAVVGCIPYLKGGPGPSAPCCNGVKGLVAAASTPADRKTACLCLKQDAGAIKGINLKLAAGLPGKCGTSVPFPISLSTDCSKVH